MKEILIWFVVCIVLAVLVGVWMGFRTGSKMIDEYEDDQ